MVLGSDTGLCHLAVWMQKPTALVYSISDPAFWTIGSQYCHPIVGSKNKEHIKKIQEDDRRLDPPEVRGCESFTKEGFSADLTTEKEILEVVREILEDQTISS
jgi:ADP-heptose:LPS heptosyltransferase